MKFFLQGKERTVVESLSRRSRSGKRDQVWHDVELFELQLALRKAGVVGAWQFEPEIRADNDSPPTVTLRITTR